jgi:hypothetical protein
MCFLKSGLCALLLTATLASQPLAATFMFSTGDPDGKMAMASRPSSAGKIEIETADDFVVGSPTTLSSATFTGLVPLTFNPADIGEVRVEIYRVFPKDSTNPPSGNVPTRVNSPADVEVTDRTSTGGGLSFTTQLQGSFTAANSVLNGIHPIPNQTTGGEGPVTGVEVFFDVTFTSPISLPADHYFFAPQVELTTGDFFWLSAPKPIVPPGTPFAPDLQTWIGDGNLAPDWLRVGTDIVGGTPAPTFNAAFSLEGTTGATSVPEPSALLLLGSGAVLVALRTKRWQISSTTTRIPPEEGDK